MHRQYAKLSRPLLRLSWRMHSCGFSKSLWGNSTPVPRLDHDCFLPNHLWINLKFPLYSQVWSFPTRLLQHTKNTIRQSITQLLFYIHWYICQGDMFRPSRSSSGPPKKQIQEVLVFLHCGIPNAHKFQLQKQKCTSLYTWICFLGGPADDLLGRNMSPWHI